MSADNSQPSCTLASLISGVAADPIMGKVDEGKAAKNFGNGLHVNLRETSESSCGFATDSTEAPSIIGRYRD